MNVRCCYSCAYLVPVAWVLVSVLLRNNRLNIMYSSSSRERSGVMFAVMGSRSSAKWTCDSHLRFTYQNYINGHLMVFVFERLHTSHTAYQLSSIK
jgi:hypothetical protein